MTLYNRVTAVLALTSALRGAGTVQGPTIDRTSNGSQVTFIIQTGALTDGVHTFSLEDSDNGSSWGAVAGSGVQGTAVTALTNDDAVFELGYAGRKRYVRLKVVTTGATGGIIGAVAVLTGGRKPVTRTG